MRLGQLVMVVDIDAQEVVEATITGFGGTKTFKVLSAMTTDGKREFPDTPHVVDACSSCKFSWLQVSEFEALSKADQKKLMAKKAAPKKKAPKKKAAPPSPPSE